MNVHFDRTTRVRAATAVMAALAMAIVPATTAAAAQPAPGQVSVARTQVLPNGKAVTHPAPTITMSSVPGGSVVTAGNTPCWADSRVNTGLTSSPLKLPLGAKIIGFTADWFDVSAGNLHVRLWKQMPGQPAQGVTAVWSTAAVGFGSTASGTLAETVDPGEVFWVSSNLPISQGDPTQAGLCGISIKVVLGRSE